MSLFKIPTNTFLAPAKPVPERCMFWTVPKTCSWKSKMKYVVEHVVYLDILLAGSIYVTTMLMVQGKPKTPYHLANPVIQA